MLERMCTRYILYVFMLSLNITWDEPNETKHNFLIVFNIFPSTGRKACKSLQGRQTQ